jgi:hypothetical protein
MHKAFATAAVLAIWLLGLAPPASAAEPQPCTAAQTNAFAPVAFLVGDWAGTGNVEGANGSGGELFRYELGCHVLVRHAHSSYAGGSLYEGLMVIYPDAMAVGGMRADSYDSGGHVIHYTLLAGTQPNFAQFLSDGPTAAPTFRLTYTRHATDLEVTFELAPPGSASFMTVAHGTERAS